MTPVTSMVVVKPDEEDTSAEDLVDPDDAKEKGSSSMYYLSSDGACTS